MAAIQLDVVIFGGGAAGLWLLDQLVRGGYQVLLLESQSLGASQTVASQGIIHGGLKYSLGGLLTGSARAISEMPDIWHRCLGGRGGLGPDLSHTRLRAETCHVWRTDSIKSRLGLLAAKRTLRTCPREIDVADRPDVLRNCPGQVLQLDDQVISPPSFISDLAHQHGTALVQIDTEHGLHLDCPQPGMVEAINLVCPQTNQELKLLARQVVFTAGAGNAALRQRSGLPDSNMQRRPLHMVMLRGQLPLLNGHCADGNTTRVTITTEQGEAGSTIWQVGGQVSEDGVHMDQTQLLRHAKSELQAVLPGCDLQHVQWSTYRVDRAEAATRSGRRPENVTTIHEGNVITAWPTKLALVPQLARRIVRLLEPPANPKSPSDLPHGFSTPSPAQPPWQSETQWITDL